MAIVAWRVGPKEIILEGENLLVCACSQQRGVCIQNSPNNAVFQWCQLIKQTGGQCSWKAASLALVQ